METQIKCPICGKLTKPDYCSDECLYSDYERNRIIAIIERAPRKDDVMIYCNVKHLIEMINKQ